MEDRLTTGSSRPPSGPGLLPPPRPVLAKRGPVRIAAFCLLPIAVLVGGFFSFLTWGIDKNERELRALHKEGRFTQARITDVEARIRGATNRHDPPLRVLFEYEVNGVKYSGETGAVLSPKPGDVVRVLYLPSDPALYRAREGLVTEEEIEHVAKGRTEVVYAGLALLALVTVFVVIPFGILPRVLEVRRQLRLARHGAATTGTIVEAGRGERGSYVYHYRFAPAGGGVPLSGHAKVARWRGEALRLVAGQAVVVLHDPQRPQRHGLYVALDEVTFDGP